MGMVQHSLTKSLRAPLYCMHIHVLVEQNVVLSVLIF